VELAELNAVMQSPAKMQTIGQLLDYAENTDCFVLINAKDNRSLGEYYLNDSGLFVVPDPWKPAIDTDRLGSFIANEEQGTFTDYGYILRTSDEWQRVHEGQPVPEEYRVMAYPAPEILREESKVQPEAATPAKAPQPVTPILLNGQNSAERMKEITDRLETGIQELFESAYSANKFANIMGPINAQLGNMSYVLCAITGGALALLGITGLTLGGLASFLTFNKSFNMPISQVSQQFNSIVMALAGAKRVFDLLDEKPETDEGYVTLVRVKKENGQLIECKERTGMWAWKHTHQADGSVDYVELKGEVVFDDVDFGYNDEKIVLHNVSLFAKPGQKIAFVGSTGAGKTTITNLINRFYDIQDGKIRYDGININKIKKADLRRSLGIVLQDTHLFTDTVMNNIRFGRLDATEEEVIAAAKLANADTFIRQLPDGYQTVLTGDGANLSQGQRQLLSIARAAVADPPVLILDEATSSIDTRTEKIVQEGMDKLMKGRTTFVIAHRLSTVRNSDCIMVLEQGRIIERGTHGDLIGQKGRYYQLYTGNGIGE